MKKLTNENGDVFGPFNFIEEHEHGYLCDGCLFPFSVTGNCSTSDWVGPLPSLPAPQMSESERWEAIKQIRDYKTQNGGYKVGSAWFHSDTFSRTQQLGLVLMGNNIPVSLQWKTMQGTFVTMTALLAQQVFSAAALQDASLFAHAEYLKANPSVDITSGWPETYNGL